MEDSSTVLETVITAPFATDNEAAHSTAEALIHRVVTAGTNPKKHSKLLDSTNPRPRTITADALPLTTAGEANSTTGRWRY